MSDLRQRYNELSAACSANGGRLLAVAKRQPMELLEAAYAMGQRDFAQSYVQEAIAVREALERRMPEARWHFIGRIQSNKTRHLEQGWYRIHSVDRIRIAKRLGTADCLIQVRLGGEHSKAGVDPGKLKGLIEAIRCESTVRIRGLMALPPPLAEWGNVDHFADLARRRDALMDEGLLESDGGELSMGTSGDFQKAIAAGSDWLRIGTGLFGARMS